MTLSVTTSKPIPDFSLWMKYTGELRVLAKILSLNYLWNEVRVQGGAYGSGFVVSETGTKWFTIAHIIDDDNVERY